MQPSPAPALSSRKPPNGATITAFGRRVYACAGVGFSGVASFRSGSNIACKVVKLSAAISRDGRHVGFRVADERLQMGMFFMCGRSFVVGCSLFNVC